MEEYEEGQKECPRCHWQNPDNVQSEEDNEATLKGIDFQPEDALNPGMILRGRYIVGTVRRTSEKYRIYMSYDALFSRKVLLLEYFPTIWSKRGPDGVLLVKEGKNQEFFAGLSDFRVHANHQICLDETGQTLEVWSVFDENHTSYAVLENPVKGQTVDQVMIFVDGFFGGGQVQSKGNNAPCVPCRTKTRKKQGFFARLFGN
jgi:hypothetical protein